MKKSLMKDQFLHFITVLIVGILLGYLYHDLMNGIRIGIPIGIGFFIGEMLIGKRRKQRDQEKIEKKY